MKILLDVNILKPECIEKIKQSNILDLIKTKKLNFYISDALLLQRFPHLFRYDKDLHDEIWNFLFNDLTNGMIFADTNKLLRNEFKKNRGKKYCFHGNQVTKNLKENFAKKRYININNTCNSDLRAKKKLKELNYSTSSLKKDYFNQKLDYIKNDLLEELKELNLPEESEKVALLNINLIRDKEKLIEWKYKFIISYHLIVENLGLKKNNYTKFILDRKQKYPYTHVQIQTMLFWEQYDKKYDEDSPRDNTYIVCMKDLDILLTNDKKYIKDCFNYIYGDTKKILTLDNFLEYLRICF